MFAIPRPRPCQFYQNDGHSQTADAAFDMTAAQVHAWIFIREKNVKKTLP